MGRNYGINKLLINQSNINPDFFDLSTGLAGEILQKIANYQLHTAFVVDPQTIKSKRFMELMSEANHLQEYRFFTDRQAAINWLLSLD